ncbi:M16 family metallopeptidase [Helicobacter kayseriensis]|uniref:M16 family metallopeptidase n=1 Tax=Helicobacter kayseriensis TaxID=2905877 RepID=UPI001E4D6B8E|nr:pitrilysin family protein [Helicobacter kayseriensis]MCE3047398.1 insulinase family protein [Helicobacter kayseriensis]MCE3048931.1 insulinase family protein [Helicobacter kayseriensis]
MRSLILFMFVLGGIMLGANLKTIQINGIKIPVIYEKSSIIPTGAVQLVFSGSGSAYNEGIQGLSYLSSLLLNEGTKEFGGVKFASLLEEKAISLYASSSQEFLEIDLSFLKDQEEEALKLLAMLLQSPNLTEKALNKVKQTATASLLAKENDYDYLASIGLSQMLFKNTPLQYPSRGNPRSIQAISLKQIKDYLDRSLSVSNLNIVVGGDLEIDLTLERLVKILEKLPIGQKSQARHYDANAEAQSKTQYKPTEQAYIYFGSPFVLKDYKNEAYKAKVMSFILGASGFGSRMMEEIRVKNGLAYSAYMRVNLSKLATYASGYLQTKIANQDQSIKLVKKVVEGFVKNGATQEELDGAKKFLLGSEPLRNETLSQRLGTAFSNYFLGLSLDYQKQELQKIQDLSLDELNDFIASHKEILDLSFSIVTK